MAKIQANVGRIKDKDGNDFNPDARTAGTGNSFRLIEPGFYVAVLNTLKLGEYRAAFKGHKSSAADGKWTYWKITPDITLLNDWGTIINRQDVQIGVMENGQFVRPDGDTSKSAIWTAAQYFLAALGLLSKDDNGEFTLDFDDATILSRVLKVKVGTGGYIKGERGYSPSEMEAMLLDANDGMPYDFEDIPELIARWNDDNGYDPDSDTCLKPKNVILNYYGLDAKAIADGGFFQPEGSSAVFVTEKDYDLYLQLLDAAENYQEPSF